MAVVLHNSVSTVGTGSAGVQDVSHAIKIRDVPERYLVFTVAYRSTTGTSTAFWQSTGGTAFQQAMTLLGSASHGTSGLRVEIWGLLAPDVSTTTLSRVVFTPGASVRWQGQAVCYQGVNQTTPIGTLVSSAIAFPNGTTLASPLGKTEQLTVTTVANDLVVDAIALDSTTTSSNLNSEQDATLCAGPSPSTPNGSIVRLGTSFEKATTTSTDMRWQSFVGANPTSVPPNWTTGEQGMSYVHIAVPLKPSTSIAPYWVFPPNEPVAIGSSTAANVRWVSIADWPARGAFTINRSGSANNSIGESGTGINLIAKQFTAHTTNGGSADTGITGAAGVYAGAANIGEASLFRMREGDCQSVNGTGTLTMNIPNSGVCAAAVDDIMLLSVYSEGSVSGPTVSATTPVFTQIDTQTVAGASAPNVIRHTLLYKRLTAGDISTGTLSIPFSSTPIWRVAVANLYRGCVATGTPYVTAGAGAPVKATATASAPTVPTITTPAADHTVYISILTSGGNATMLPPISGCVEREKFDRVWAGDYTKTTAGAIAAQTMLGLSVSNWAAQAITLIPNTSAAVAFDRSLAQSRPYFSDGVTRVAAYIRSALQTRAFVTGTAIGSMGAFVRTLLQNGRAFESNTLTKVVAFTRSATQTRAFGSGTAAKITSYIKALTQTRAFSSGTVSDTTLGFRRTLAQTRAFSSGTAAKIVAFTRTLSQVRAYASDGVLVIEAGATAFARSLVQNGRAFSSGTASRLMTMSRSITQTHAFSSGTAAKLTRYLRALAQTRAPSNSSAVRVAAYNRSSTQARPTGFGFSIIATPTGGVISFYDFGSPNQPLYQKIDDVAGTFPGVQFYFEAQLKSNSNSASYAELYNVTLGATVAGSQVVTSNPHTTSQIVRSTSAITLVSGHVYKARIGHASGIITTPTACRIIARDVA